MRTRLPLPLSLLATIAFAVAGCGSGSSQTASTSPGSTNPGTTSVSTTNTTATVAVASGTPLSRTQIISRADAICRRLNAELDTAKSKISTQADIVHIAPQRAALEQSTLVLLSKLTPPASMAHDYQQILTDRQVLIEDLTKLGQDAAANNLSAEQPVFSSSAAVVSQLAVTGQRDGFKYCKQVG
jgi:hypothetical protein